MEHLQQQPHCDEEIKQFLSEPANLLRDRLGPLLTGVYLHGSLAMGGFCSSRGDLDVLVVAEFSLPRDLLRALRMGLAELSNACPAKKGLELSIITREAVKPGPCSKEEGGVWGVNHLPHPHSSMAEQALQAMRGEEILWDPAALAEFAGWTTASSRAAGSGST